MDEASKDKNAIEEAKRIASNFGKIPTSSTPHATLGYDPKGLAREAFDQIVDRRFEERDFESLWDLLAEVKLGPPLGYLTEHETRVFLKSVMHGLNAFNYREAAKQEKVKADIHSKTACLLADERLGLKMKTEFRADLRSGQLHQATEAELASARVETTLDILKKIVGG